MSSAKSGASTEKNPSSNANGSLVRPFPLTGIHAVTDWAWTQQRVNFVLVAPVADSPWRLVEPTVRGEAPTHHSSLRYFLTDGERRLRVKQYYNDWWIPTVPDISFVRPGRPLLVGDDVWFLGRDYRRHEAACGHRWGTNTEFSLESGTMSDAEWTSLLQSLDALVPESKREVRGASYARRNYWNRWGRTLAPWDTHEISSLKWSELTSAALEATAWACSADRWTSVPGVPDSVGQREAGELCEVQIIFRAPLTQNCSAWLRVLDGASPKWRPLVDSSERNRPVWTPLRIEGVDVERATMDPTVGNWFYAWRDGAKSYEFHLRARKGFGQEAADGVLARLLHPS